MLVEFVSQSSRDADSIVADPSRLLNVYRERAGTGVAWLKSVLAMTPHTALPGVFVTAMGVVDGRMFAVCGGALFEVKSDGSYALLGAVEHGQANVAGNNGRVTVRAGLRYFVYNLDTNTLTEPVAGAFADFGSLDTVGNYTVLTEAGGRKFQWSELADPTGLPGLSFSTADGKDDLLVRAVALFGQLWLFKQESTERWYLTGAAGASAFERTVGGVSDVGLRGHDLICKFAGGAFMVGSDGRASMIGPGGVQPISTPAVETSIKLHKPEKCITYEDEGHVFGCIVFRDAPAWCYDFATGEWHERAEGAALLRWRVGVSVKFAGDWYVGRDDGQISVLTRADIDGDVPLVREATSRNLYLDGNRTIAREIEFYARQGFANVDVMMALSRDNGMTWSPWKTRMLGPSGNYDRRAIWRNQGQFRQLSARIRWTAAANVNISAQARLTT